MPQKLDSILDIQGYCRKCYLKDYNAIEGVDEKTVEVGDDVLIDDGESVIIDMKEECKTTRDTNSNNNTADDNILDNLQFQVAHSSSNENREDNS